MATPQQYASPAAFKQALEQRLRTQTRNGDDLVRRRQVLVFNRFLARVVQALGDAVTLKGGLVLEMRIDRARTTKDIDLRLSGPSNQLLSQLARCGQSDMGDFMSFDIELDRNHPVLQNEGMRYEGARYRAQARLAGKVYGHAFGVDIAFGDPLLGALDIAAAEDTLAFAGIAPPRIRLYPIETHIAEKLHAYTLPRARINSRVKDLPDIALLARIRELQMAPLRAAIDQTFTYRNTHTTPTDLPDPPNAWPEIYAAMATEDELPWKTLDDLVVAVRQFIEVPLGQSPATRWSPETWRWDAI